MRLLMKQFIHFCFLAISIVHVTGWKFHKITPRSLKWKIPVISVSALIFSQQLVFPAFADVMLETQPTSSFIIAAEKGLYESTVSNFIGNYKDPNHPEGYRNIDLIGNKIVIKGSDFSDGKNVWEVNALQVSPSKISVDFSVKGGPKDLLGVYDPSIPGIKWPDGNAWTKQ